MIDKWFVNDINEVLGQQGRVVVTDAKGEGKFLLDFLPHDIVLLEVGDTELDEIKAKYEAEAHHAGEPVVFYLHRPKDSLTFLLEYAEIEGCIVLDDMESYTFCHQLFHLSQHLLISYFLTYSLMNVFKGSTLIDFQVLYNQFPDTIILDSL